MFNSWDKAERHELPTKQIETKTCIDFSNDMLEKCLTEPADRLPIFIGNCLRDMYKDFIFYNNQFIWFRGSEPLLLIAHMDIVHEKEPTLSELLYSKNNKIVSSIYGLGADDRAGIFAVLSIIKELIKQKKKLPSILFTYGEESGNVGAGAFVDYLEDTNTKPIYNCIIEIDRRDFNDVVCYGDSNETLSDLFVKQHGFVKALGSCTDITEICPYLKVSGVNISTAYFNEHTSDEILYIDGLVHNINRVCDFVLYTFPTIKSPLVYKEKPQTQYGVAYDYYKNYNKDYHRFNHDRDYGNEYYAEKEDQQYKEEDNVMMCENCGSDIASYWCAPYEMYVCKNCKSDFRHMYKLKDEDFDCMEVEDFNTSPQEKNSKEEAEANNETLHKDEKSLNKNGSTTNKNGL